MPSRDITLASLPPCSAWLSSRGRAGSEVLLADHHGPADSCHLVGQGHGHELAWLAGEQLGDPGVLAASLGVEDRHGAGDQQAAQIAVAALADGAEPELAAGALLAGHQAERGGEVAPAAEGARLDHEGGKGAGEDRPVAGYSDQMAVGRIVATP